MITRPLQQVGVFVIAKLETDDAKTIAKWWYEILLNHLFWKKLPWNQKS
jgi:hypothetical protein